MSCGSVGVLWSRRHGWVWLRRRRKRRALQPRWRRGVCGRGGERERESPPVCHNPPPQHQTCRIMLIYGDGWATLSTESGQVHQRIYLFTRLKGAKASATQRLTLRVSPGPEPGDLRPDSQKKTFQALLRLPACKFSWPLAGRCSHHDRGTISSIIHKHELSANVPRRYARAVNIQQKREKQ